ncbi:MAG: glycoside hydrolase family 9 protein [Lentisphaeria bacterium]|nr:glycoside hydrolase family 9 protein [Lentisphaeria bacterium]
MFKYNHIGYRPSAPKFFIIDKVEQEEFRIQTIDESVTWKDVYTGKLEKTGEVYMGDFSAITTPGDYRICCGEKKSYNFVIKKNPYALLERLVTIFYTWQRCGSKKGWAGLCHQEVDNLAGTGKKLDMRGGYHQSGDLRCWHDGCSSALYGYLRYAEESTPVWEEGLFEEDLRWGLDYFRKTVSPEGFIYDCQFVPLGWGPRDYYNTPAPLSDHYNICRLLARSSLYFREKDPVYAAENLALAEKIWSYVEKSSFFDTPYIPPVKDLPRGTQGAGFYWQNRKNCTGMDCAAAAAASDLFYATKKEEYRERVISNMKKVLACQIREGEASRVFRDRLDNEKMAFHDCGYGHSHSGMLFLSELVETAFDPASLPEWKEALERYCDMLVREFRFLGIDSNMPAPYARNYLNDLPPDVPFFKASPIPLVHHSVASTSSALFKSSVFASAYRIFGKKEYEFYSQRCLDYLLGWNKQAASCITGIGYNHPIHNVFGQFFPSTPQLPGGVIHHIPGEYDLPAAGMLLRALTHFRDKQ